MTCQLHCDLISSHSISCSITYLNWIAHPELSFEINNARSWGTEAPLPILEIHAFGSGTSEFQPTLMLISLTD